MPRVKPKENLKLLVAKKMPSHNSMLSVDGLNSLNLLLKKPGISLLELQ